MATLIHEIRDIGRFNKIVAVMASVGLHDIADRLKLKGKRLFDLKFRKEKHYARSTPEKLRIAFERLGPTFIKFGQLLSVRPDLVPKDYVIEFSKLQDSVPPFDYEDAKAIVEAELGKPVHHFFKYFSRTPLSAGSIAQVHVAILKNGQKVIVKVQRPDIKEKIEHDMHILFYFAKLIEKYIEDSKKYNPHEVVEEFSKWMQKELDFFIEARNAEKLYQNMKNLNYIKIPKIYWKYSTRRVLTMEFLDGSKLGNLKDSESEKKKILQKLVDASLQQIVEDGFFHADTHPGNILILKNNVIGLVDFGIVGHIDAAMKEQIASLLISMLNKDIDGIINSVLDMNISDAEINVKKLRQDIHEALNLWYVKRAKEYTAEDLVTLTKLSTDHGIKLPVDFVLLTKQILTLDGVSQLLDPNYYFIEEIEPYMRKLIAQRSSLKFIAERVKERSIEAVRFADKLPNQLVNTLRMLEKGKIRLEVEPKEIREVEHLATQMEVAAEKIALAVMISAIVVGAALFSRVEQLPFIFGWPLSKALFLIAAVFGFWMILSILRERA